MSLNCEMEHNIKMNAWADNLEKIVQGKREFSDSDVIFYLLNREKINRFFFLSYPNTMKDIIGKMKKVYDKLFDDYSEYYYIKYEGDNDNLLENVLISMNVFENHKDDDWNSTLLSECVIEEFLDKHLDEYQWDWYVLSRRCDISMEFIEKHIKKPWLWDLVCEDGTRLSLDFVERHEGFCSYPVLSFLHCINEEYIEKHLGEDWDYYFLSLNPNITVDFIEKYSDKDWDYRNLSLNSNLTLDFIEKHINELDFHNLSSSYITLDFIKKHIDERWNWYKLSSNNHIITEEFVIENINKCWCWLDLFKNPNITSKLLMEKNDDIVFVSYFLKASPNITEEFLDKLDYNLIYDALSFNPNITLDFIERHINENWNWKILSSDNPNITLEFVQKHAGKSWNWNYLLEKFLNEKNLFDKFYGYFKDYLKTRSQ